MIRIYCDCCFRPLRAGSPCYVGFVVQAGNGAVLSAKAWRISVIDSLQGELEAIKLAVAYAAKRGISDVILYSDSLAAVLYLNGGKCRNPNYKRAIRGILAILVGCQLNIEFVWLPRYLNKQADALCRQIVAIDTAV
ncbi:MAG: ribonuclease H family protein [Bacillota bacterium]